MKRYGLVALAVSAVIVLSGCGGGGETQYDRDYKSGIQKYNTGAAMTEGEYKAVQNYKNWSSKQGEKTYDEWNK